MRKNLDRAFKVRVALEAMRSEKTMARIACMRATTSWWSDTFRFLSPDTTRQIPGAVFYKGRWNQPNPFSYNE